MLILSMNVDKKSLETEFVIGICCQIGDKWQSKTMFPTNFDPRSLIVKTPFSIAAWSLNLPFLALCKLILQKLKSKVESC